MPNIELVNKIIALQERNGLSDRKFSKKIGVNNSTWSYIKSGKRNPGGNFLAKLTKAFPEASIFVVNAWTQDTSA